MRQMESKSIIVFYLQFFTDIEIVVKSIIVLIDDAHAAIGRRNFQPIQQMPFGTAKVMDFPTKTTKIMPFKII